MTEEEHYGRLDITPADNVIYFEDMVVIEHGYGSSTKATIEEWLEYHSKEICEW